MELCLGTGVDSLTFPGGKCVFGYPTPQLTALTIYQFWRRPFVLIVPSELFDGCAPQLRFLKLLGLGLPFRCPALGCVTRAIIEEDPRAIQHLFRVMPLVEELHFSFIRDFEHLPAVPSGSSLAKVNITGKPPSFDKLHSLGYTRVRELTVFALDAPTVLAEAAGYATEFTKTALDLSFCPWLYMEGSDGCLTRIAAYGVEGSADIQRCLGDGTPFRYVKYLMLPARFDDAHPLALLSGDLVFPGVLGLIITVTSDTAHSLLDPGVACATIRLPKLACLELTQEPGQERAPEPVCVQDLASFIVDRLRPDDVRSLEIIIDPESTIRLEGGGIEGAGLERLLETVPNLRPHLECTS